MARKRGIDLDNLDDLNRSVNKKAHEEFEKLMAVDKRSDTKVMCIEAYEEILLDKRTKEREILNLKRRQEIEKNRPPQPGWYMNHGKEFSKEVFRNRVSLRPRNSNAEYLAILQDPSIY